MWEAIDKNKLRSRVLIGLLGGLLVALGFAIGMSIDPGAGVLGAAAALLLWFLLLLAALFLGDQALLLSARARRIQKADAPQLWNIVEEMSIAAGLPQMPRVYLIDDDSPNAFAAGTKPEAAAVAVTSGLLRRLNRDELQGVIAHEVGHVANLDVRFLTLASVMLGAIVLLSDLFLRSLRYGGRRRIKLDPRIQIGFFVVAIVLAILAPIAARLLYFAVSRRREFLADASAARFTRYPEGLASALEKISVSAMAMGKVNRAVAPLLTVNPLQDSAFTSLFSTHPSTDKRVQILRSMGGAGYVDYEKAFHRVEKGGEALIGAKTLRALGGTVAARAPSPESPAEAAARARAVTDVLDRMASFVPVGCTCGLRMKLPPELDLAEVGCPRCGRKQEVPHVHPIAELDAAPAAGGPAFRYERKGAAWESFHCSCGKVIQLSPSFKGAHVACNRCRRLIEVATPVAVAERQP